MKQPSEKQPSKFRLSARACQDLREFASDAEDEAVTPRDCVNMAKALLVVVAATFDTSSAKCGTCGLNHYTSHAEKGAHKMVTGMVTRLRRLVREHPWAPDTE